MVNLYFYNKIFKSKIKINELHLLQTISQIKNQNPINSLTASTIPLIPYSSSKNRHNLELPFNQIKVPINSKFEESYIENQSPYKFSFNQNKSKRLDFEHGGMAILSYDSTKVSQIGWENRVGDGSRGIGWEEDEDEVEGGNSNSNWNKYKTLLKEHVTNRTNHIQTWIHWHQCVRLLLKNN